MSDNDRYNQHMNELATKQSWWSRTLTRLGLTPVERIPSKMATDVSAGYPAQPGYSLEAAMSAYAAFPWVVACVNAKATDLSGLPLMVVRGSGEDAEMLQDHPALDLLRNPSSKVTGVMFRRQMLVDLELSGNAFSLLVGDRRFLDTLSLLRLHPQGVRIVPDDDGTPRYFEYTSGGASSRFDFSSVIQIRRPSWENSSAGLYGEGLIRSLHNDLEADLAAQRSAKQSAAKGRPDAIISPKSDGDVWTSRQISEIRARLDQMMRESGGALIMGGQASYTPLSWSPKDMEYKELRTMVRDSVLGASGVPPTRVGLPTANYATAKESMRLYWENLKGEAALIDSELTKIAQLWEPDLRIVHDFSAVGALQTDRTERLSRVQQWWLLGLPLTQAATMEGFDLPEDLDVEDSPSRETDEASEAALVDVLSRDLTEVQTEDQRAAIWHGFIDQVHKPAERGLTLALTRYFRGAKKRYADRAEQALDPQKSVKKSISDTALAMILDELGEKEKLKKAIGSRLLLAIKRAFAITARQMRLDLEFDEMAANADASLDLCVARVIDTTHKDITALVTTALDEGDTVADIAVKIKASKRFSNSEALLIARTETTRATSQGAVRAMSSALNEGVKLQKEWLTSRDGNVREAHQIIDGQIVDVDGSFNSMGSLATHPGEFGSAALDCNCRCTVIPKLAGRQS